jgi:glycosyl transferase family 10 (putative fucosyltransferase)
LSRVILFYNTMWGTPLDYPRATIPAPYVLSTDLSAADEASAIVFHVPTLPADVIPNKVSKKSGQLWVAWSMECEAYYPRLNDPVFMDFFDLTMTYRLNSDIPVPYLDHGLTGLLRGAPAKKEDGNLLNAFVSSSYNNSGRIEYLTQLMSRMDVHSYGELFRNSLVERDIGRETKLHTMRTYKFTLAFENAIATDYVTEKFYDPLIVGSVPVYLGAPNVEDFAPGDNCFINAADWNPAELAQYLIELAENETEYSRLLEWKTRPFRERFVTLIDMVKTHSFARLCGKIEEMRGRAA